MAHIAKYKVPSVGHMLAHYRRDESSLERDNIDQSLTKRNVTFGHVTNDQGGVVVRSGVDLKPNWDTVNARIQTVNARAAATGKRATRKDAVVMADLVVTLPKNVPPRDSDKFFAYTYMWLGKKLGRDNLMGGFVHRDEWRTRKVKDEKTGEVRVERTGEHVRDHMHAPFTPILDGRFNYKQMVPRSFYKTMHKELGDFLEQKLGYRPEVELEAKTVADKVASKLDHGELDAMQSEIIDPAKVEAERIVAAARAQAATIVRDAEMRKAELVTQIADKEGDLAELDNQLDDVRMDIEDEQDRLECLRQRADGVARDVAELRPIAADVRGWEAAGKAERGAILDRIAARCAGAARAARAAIEELGDRIWALMRPRKPKTEQRSLDDVMREATEAARASEALSRNHVAPTNSRPRGQAR